MMIAAATAHGQKPVPRVAISNPASSPRNGATSSTRMETVKTRNVNGAPTAPTTPTKSTASRRGSPASSCKRRRLASEEENIAIPSCNGLDGISSSARKLNYKRIYQSDDSSSDDSGDDDDDSFEQDIAQQRQASILRKIKRINNEDDGDQLMHTSAFAKLYEHVKGDDKISNTKAKSIPNKEEDCDAKASDEGVWKYRGSGHVKFIKCMQEGYNCGMIKMELTKNGALETLMCHELTNEEVVSMPSKKGKAFTWRCKDWAYFNTVRTFALRFDDDMDALKWKAQVEQSKINNCRVRRGLDIPDLSAVDDICSTFKNLSTVHTNS